MLQDELADSKNQLDRNEKRLHAIQAQNKALELKIEQLQKEAVQWQEFSSVIDKVEETGLDYIKMMQGIKSQMKKSAK
jgi:FtsZ-binding cell division protein ZapB